MAEIDLGNVMGPQGEDGSQWYQGTAITGTSSTGTIFSSSGISNARVNDKYINTSTGNFYTCTVGGNASTAKWAYSGNLKGPQGNTGPAGATGQVDKDTPIEFTEASTESDIKSGESLSTMFGKLKKSIKTFRTSIGTLSSLKTTVKDSLVNAINELKTGLGTVGELDTTAKDSVVNAVNELKSNVDALDNSVDTLNGDLNDIDEKINYYNVSNCTFESILPLGRINGLTTFHGVNILGISDLENDNDVIIELYRYPGEFFTYKSIVYDFRSKRILTLSCLNGATFGWIDLTLDCLPQTGGTISGDLYVSGNISGSKNVDIPYDNHIGWSGEAIIYAMTAQQMFFRASSEGNYAMHLGVADGIWALNPEIDSQLTLGTPQRRWGSLNVQVSPQTSSDQNQKNTIKDMDERYIKFFMNLLPKSYKFNNGTSGRTHVGFIAQDVESAMESAGLSDLEFAGFCRDQKTVPIEKTQKIKSINPETGESEYKTIKYTEGEPVDGEYIYSLRYEEFIALNTLMIQKLMERVEALENKIS